MNMRRVLLALAIAIHGADRAGTVFAQGPAPQPAAGFVVEPVATDPDVVFPMFACFDDRGRLFVAESSGLDLYAELQAQTRKCRIRLLEDPDPRTGRYRRSRVWADKLVFPMGLAWRNGKLYVADPPDLVTLEDTDGDGVADRRRVVLTGFGHKDNGSLHGLVFGPDGRLYMTMGAPDGYRLERAGLPPLTGKSGALIRCRPDGAEPEVLSRGFVNLVEIVFTARGDILGTDNWFQKPSGGVRDALVHCLDGGLYPYEPDVGTSYPTTGAPLPAAALFPAVALSGITRSESIAFPAAMRGNLFAAQHNARKVSRHELAAQGATFRTVDHDFVTSADPDFHPADVLEAGDGSLLVVDTGSWYVHHCPTGQIRKTMAKGGIYRVRPQTWAPPDDPWGLKVDWEGPPSSVAALLADERPAVRDKAVATLARRGRRAIGAVETVLRTAPQGTGATAVKQLAIWVLAQIDDEEALPPLRQALSDKKDDVVIVAAQALGLRRDQHAAATLTRLLRRAPAVRLAAAQALARCGNAESVPALWQALKTAEDRFVEHALVHALHHLADAATLQRALDDPHPGAQKAALVLLDQPPRSRELLEAAAVLQRVAAADAELRHTALRIVQGRPEWAAHAVKLFQSWMHQPSLTSDQQRGLRDMVRAFERDPSMQRLVAEAIADKRGSTPPERQVLLLEAMAEFELSKPPPAIVDALLAALARPRPEVRKQAVRTAAILQLPQLDDALGRLADDAQEPAELRLEALRGVVLRRPKLSSAAFDLLHEELGPQADPLARRAAAALTKSNCAGSWRRCAAKRSSRPAFSRRYWAARSPKPPRRRCSIIWPNRCAPVGGPATPS